VRDTRHRERCNPKHLAGAAEARAFAALTHAFRLDGICRHRNDDDSPAAMYFRRESVADQTGDRTV
jgi:hypothetical protein